MMKKKIVGIIICMLMVLPVGTTLTIADHEPNANIKINNSSGATALNQKSEDVAGASSTNMVIDQEIGRDDVTPPSINFVPPTPENGTIQSDHFIPVNISANDENDFYTFVDFNRDLRLWMRMDDVNSSGEGATVYDLSSYQNNGIAYGNAHQITQGYYGKGFSFDGTGDYISIPDAASLDITQSITISAWFKTSTTSKRQVIAAKTAGGDNTWLLEIYSNNKINFYLNAGGTASDLYSSTAINANTWYHVVAVYNGTKRMIYLNGILSASVADSGSINVNNREVTIGDWSSHNRPLNGVIDEVLLFNRALGPEEIKSLYNGKVNHYMHTFTGLPVGSHFFTGYAVDQTGNNNQTETRQVTIVGINHPPNLPSNPVPANKATDIPINALLSWTGGDPDGDPCTYDVYFGTTNQPPIQSHNQSSTIYDPGLLNYNTSYYWEIVAWDFSGASTVGALWQFTTHRPANIYVGGTGPNNYTTIQAGINAAQTGDTVFVYHKIYYEHVTINKEIHLIGENKTTTIINGSDVGDVIYVTSPNVEINGFTIQGSGSGTSDAGIESRSQYTTVFENRIIGRGYDSGPGIYLSGSSSSTIANNTVIACGNWGAIYLASSSYNIISGNTITNGYWTAIGLEYSSHNIITGNTMMNNDFWSVELWESSNNTISENIIINNSMGIDLYDESNTNAIIENVLSGNQYEGIHIDESSDEAIQDNMLGLGGGIIIDGGAVPPKTHWLHTIQNNTICGKPIYYYRDAEGITVPSDAGQVILADSHNCSVENLTLTLTPHAIQLGFCTDILIAGNTITIDWYGDGIYTDGLSHCMFTGNTITSSYIYKSAVLCGINLDYPYDNNSITQNIFEGFGTAVRILARYQPAPDTIVFENTIRDSYLGTGIGLTRYNGPTSPGLQIIANTLINCSIAASDISMTILNNHLIGGAISIGGGLPEFYTTHIIEGNVVNGKPVYYYKYTDDIVVPQDAGQVILANCSDITINDLIGNPFVTLLLAYCKNIDISSCTSPGISIISCTNISISNCVQTRISISSSSTGSITGNTFVGCGRAIDLEYSSSFLVSKNVITNCALPIFLIQGDSFTVQENIITNSTSPRNSGSIYLDGVSNSVFRKNTIVNSLECGIMLQDYNANHHNTIIGNTITHISPSEPGYSLWCYGIEILSNNHDNDIIENTITNSEYFGIITSGSSNNRIYHNNLIDNMVNVYDYNGNNAWDNGYPSGGNYWDNYTGYDSNCDGIGDTSYNIPGTSSNQDHYPLMHRFILGDMNVDGNVDFGDINPFILALSNPTAYQDMYHLLPSLHGDINQDGVLDFGDINPFVALLTSG